MQQISIRGIFGMLLCALALSGAAAAEAGIRLNGNMRVTRINRPEESDAPSVGLFDIKNTESSEFAVPPLAGFSPLVAMTASNKRSVEEFDSEHHLEYAYSGSPLTGSASQNYILGVFDSGAMADLVAGQSADVLGLTEAYWSEATMPIGGVGGQIDAVVSQPIGLFAAGLEAIDPNGLLNLSQVKGHSNTCILISPEIACDTGESISGVVGTPFVSFFTTVIENDNPQTVFHQGQYRGSPNVRILPPSSPLIPSYPRSISMQLNSYASTASYWQLFDPYTMETTVESPTLLSLIAGFLPTGGVFMTTLYVAEGVPGPTNPLQPMTVMVDTGAQSSIITPGMAAKLSLPITPDFTIDVCGVGGTVTDVPVYRIDYVKINALGGALEFSDAPFVMLDLSLGDGTPLDGVLGMNFFWNRNLIFKPDLMGSSFLQVSEPGLFGDADVDHDDSINLADFATFAAAWRSESGDSAYHPACDLYLDGRVDEQDLAAFLMHWLAAAGD